MITEYLLKKALDHTLDVAKRLLRESRRRLITTKEDLEQSLNYHIRSIKNWSAEVSFSDLQRAKTTQRIFLELDLFLYPRRIRVSADEKINTIPLKSMFNDYAGHFILLGQPGAGKTTSMKYFCQILLHGEFLDDRFAFPIFIRLRDFNSRPGESQAGILIDEIYNILGLRLETINEPSGMSRLSDGVILKEQLVVNVLDSLNVLLILDGFDELADSQHRREALKDFKTLCTHLETSTVILTSRTGEFVYNIENTATYEICPLADDQIARFASRWLPDQNTANEFLKQVNESPFTDTAIRPLTLAHLCAIYERFGKIPDKPKTVYRKIVYLLLEKWDQERDVKRFSRYATFEVDRKIEFLSHLAYMLTIKFQKTVFSVDDLLKVYKEIHHDYDLDNKEALQVVGELETHTGLFLQTGYECFEFAHKSLQEYLAAEYIVRLPTIPHDPAVISVLPNELAIAVVISSSPSDYLADLVLTRILGKELSGSVLFQTEDFVEPEKLCNRLKRGKDAVSVEVYGQFTQEHRDLIELCTPSQLANGELVNTLTVEFNSLLDCDRLELFVERDPSKEEIKGLDEPWDVFLRRRNRLLLERAYPKEIAKNQLTHRFIKRFLTRLWLEKPDFNSATKIGVALLLLYSMYVESKMARKQLNEYDPLLNEMSEAMKLIIKGNSIGIVRDGYKVKAKYETKDGDSICQVVCRKGSDTGLPETLFIKSSFWERAIKES